MTKERQRGETLDGSGKSGSEDCQVHRYLVDVVRVLARTEKEDVGDGSVPVSVPVRFDPPFSEVRFVHHVSRPLVPSAPTGRRVTTLKSLTDVNRSNETQGHRYPRTPPWCRYTTPHPLRHSPRTTLRRAELTVGGGSTSVNR